MERIAQQYVRICYDFQRLPAQASSVIFLI
jgi:hypothetical protein